MDEQKTTSIEDDKEEAAAANVDDESKTTSDYSSEFYKIELKNLPKSFGFGVFFLVSEIKIRRKKVNEVFVIITKKMTFVCLFVCSQKGSQKVSKLVKSQVCED